MFTLDFKIPPYALKGIRTPVPGVTVPDSTAKTLIDRTTPSGQVKLHSKGLLDSEGEYSINNGSPLNWVGNALEFPSEDSTIQITEELNFRVRKGNGCFLFVLVVNP